MGTPASDLRKWVHQRRLAEAREKAELRDAAPDPVQALTRGFGLAAFASEVTAAAAESAEGMPSEDLLAYQRWARVRTTLRTT